MHFGTITTLLACTARSTVPRQRNAPVQNPLLLLRLINTLGSSIAVGCFRHRSPPDCEFAPYNVYGGKATLGLGMATLIGICCPLAAVLLYLGFGAMRDAMAEAEQPATVA